MNIPAWLLKDTVSARFNDSEKQLITDFIEANAAEPEAINSIRTLVVWLIAFSKKVMSKQATGTDAANVYEEQNRTLQQTIARLQAENETLREKAAELTEALENNNENGNETILELREEISRLQEENEDFKSKIVVVNNDNETLIKNLANVYSVAISDAEKPVIENCLQFLANFYKKEVSVNDLFRMLLWQRLHAPGSDFPFNSLLQKSKNLLQ